MKNLIRFFLILIFLIFIIKSYGQDRFKQIENKLDTLATDNPGLNEKVELSVSQVSITEFIRALAKANNLNISIDPSLNISIVYNFSNVTVKNILLFLCQKYNLDINFIGNIISITEYVPTTIEKYTPKKINLTYDSINDLLTLDLKNDSIYRVTKEITKITEKNVIFTPDLKDKLISVYIQNLPFDNALDKLAITNDLEIIQTDDGSYLIVKKEAKPLKTDRYPSKRKGRQDIQQEAAEFEYLAGSMDSISIYAINTPIVDIIKEISKSLNISFFIFSELKGNTSVNLLGITYEDLLKNILNGTTYTFKKDKEIYLFGERQIEGLRETRVIQLQHRSVENVIDFIPNELQKDVNIKEFPELNSLILSGSRPMINEIERFIKDIDQIVPVILIEVLIIDFKTDRYISTGIQAGLGEAPATTKGKVFPDVQFELNSTSINNLINSFNGFGLFNLGQVTPNFYLTISAMESEGILKVRSTPKLATLNSYEATLSIGNTEYYLEEQSSIYATQTTQTVTTRQYKSVTADLSITIKPIVSGDDQITLEIQVEQSDFTSRISPDAPPGSVTRNFSSFIRVKNEEMVLLGGLEEKFSSDTGSGLPILSRIPVIKWLFSSRTKQKSKSKLSIFIKPIISY